jgi:hypothetical protein
MFPNLKCANKVYNFGTFTNTIYKSKKDKKSHLKNEMDASSSTHLKIGKNRSQKFICYILLELYKSCTNKCLATCCN